MKKLTTLIVVVLILTGQSYTFGEFVVPGYTVQTYAQVQAPEQMAFDSQGFLYIGNGNNDWLLIGDYTDKYIQRTAPGGAPVSNYGNSGFYDADAVAFDKYGTISGTAGTLLVGCGYPGRLYGIKPNEEVITLFTDMASYNPSKMIFDSTGRLLIADGTNAAVYQTTGANPTLLFPTPTQSFNSIAVDADDRIYIPDGIGKIFVYEDGELREFATLSPGYISLAFTAGNELWEAGLYVLNDGTGNLSRFDSGGNETPIGTGGTGGPGGTADMVFGPDGALYIDASNNEILRIVPEPAIEALVDINPDSLNKNSKGQWVTVYITLPAGYDVNKIDASTIAITSLTGASCQPDYHQAVDLSFISQVGDRDEDGIPDLTVKFNRQELIANLCLDDVAVTVEGKLVTGEKFKGIDHIRVIDRGK